MDLGFEVLFFAIFASVIGFFAYRMIRHGGFKAAMFGARIDRTVGEVSGEKQGPVGVALKVHILRREAAEKLVGVEFIAKSFASYQMTPITLSVAQAQQLASLLNEAVRAP
jgi:hypothetical protein